MSRLGVLGGTFDPVHLGHLVLGEAAREQLQLETVLFVPTGHSWRKPERAITPGEQRLEMVRLAIAGNPAFEASGMEIERPGPSYTADTLEELRRERPDAELFFILGRDALLDLPHWRTPERIVELATLAVAGRAGERALAGTEASLPGLGGRIVRLKMPLIEISASDVRARVREGRSIRYLVPPPVEDYIARTGLYRRA